MNGLPTRATAQGLAALLLLAAAALSGCPGGGGSGESSAKTAGQPGGKSGEQIYLDKRCDMCHGKAREGKPGLGPPLRGIAQHWTVAELTERYFPDPIGYQNRDSRLKQMLEEYNKMKMPPVTGDPADLRKLAEYLLTD